MEDDKKFVGAGLIVMVVTCFFIVSSVVASQHDYNVANAPGVVVRADINSVLGAIATNNSAATAPSTTFANQWWFDTSTNILKQRNNANDAWINAALKDGNGWTPYRHGSQIGTGALLTTDTDTALAADSDSNVATQKAVKAYADAVQTSADTKISKSIAGEINVITEKTSLADDDVFLIEDSAASYAKKRVKKSNVITSNSGVEIFTSSGTFTAPTGITKVYISMIGAGAGGGAGWINRGGGGGSGGSFYINRPHTVVPATGYTVTINAGGAAGSDGGTTVFDSLIALGGKAGTAGSGSVAPGGISLGGFDGAEENPPGGGGTEYFKSGDGGQGDSNAGSGGGTPWGAGAATTSNVGDSASANTGAGGAGGHNTGQSGGAGGSGICIVMY